MIVTVLFGLFVGVGWTRTPLPMKIASNSGYSMISSILMLLEVPWNLYFSLLHSFLRLHGAARRDASLAMRCVAESTSRVDVPVTDLLQLSLALLLVGLRRRATAARLWHLSGSRGGTSTFGRRGLSSELILKLEECECQYFI